jgi:hypothetical protein
LSTEESHFMGRLLESLKKQASERFDVWVSTQTLEEQRKDRRFIQSQMLAIAQEIVPNPFEDNFDDEVVQALLRYAIETTSLVVDQPEDIDEHIVNYSNATYMRPIVLIVSNLVGVLREHLRAYWEQHELNPEQNQAQSLDLRLRDRSTGQETADMSRSLALLRSCLNNLVTMDEMAVPRSLQTYQQALLAAKEALSKRETEPTSTNQ